MPSRSPSASRSSTSVGLVAGTVAAAVVAAVGWAVGSGALSAAGFVVATALAGAFAVYLIVSERRRHESVEDALHAQASFLDSLVDSIASVSSSLDPEEILDRTCGEARRLFSADRARLVEPDGVPREPRLDDGTMAIPLAVRGEPLGTLEITRTASFHRWDLIRAKVLADFAARAVDTARLLAEAQERERERARLTERVITAEQDERRRLSLFLHDGPLQSMSGIALMHDAALAAIREGRSDDAARVIASSLERERETIRSLRDLSFAIEPLVLRDQGFDAAVRALGDQVEQSHRLTVSVSVAPGERLAEKAQVALYQIIRESLNQAVRRQPDRIDVAVTELADGGVAAEVADDGMGERRRASVEAIEERVRVLNGHLSVENRDEGGTVVRVQIPAYVAAAGAG